MIVAHVHLILKLPFEIDHVVYFFTLIIIKVHIVHYMHVMVSLIINFDIGSGVEFYIFSPKCIQSPI